MSQIEVPADRVAQHLSEQLSQANMTVAHLRAALDVQKAQIEDRDRKIAELEPKDEGEVPLKAVDRK